MIAVIIPCAVHTRGRVRGLRYIHLHCHDWHIVDLVLILILVIWFTAIDKHCMVNDLNYVVNSY